MEKRVTFNERWLPYVLVAPQMIITLVFFFWPSGQAIWQQLTDCNERVLNAAQRSLDEAEQARLHDYLERVLHALRDKN